MTEREREREIERERERGDVIAFTFNVLLLEENIARAPRTFGFRHCFRRN